MAEQAGSITSTTEDLGERDLLEACEAAFNIDIPEAEAEYLRTVGDLYGVIRWRCQSERMGRPGCAIAASYRKLRGQLQGQGVRRAIRPTSALEALLGPDPRAQWTQLRRAFGPGLPRLELSDGQHVFVSMLVAMGLAGGIFGGLITSDSSGNSWLGVAVGLAILGVVLLGVTAFGLFFARTIPLGLKTVADLARTLTLQGTTGLHAPEEERSLWSTLEDVLRRDGGVEGPVTADLKIELPRRAKAA